MSNISRKFVVGSAPGMGLASRFGGVQPPALEPQNLRPTALHPVAAMRIAEDTAVVRTLTSDLAGAGGYCFDEYILKAARGYVGVNSGWQIWAHRASVDGRVFKWLQSPDAATGYPNADFAIRLGDHSSAYHSGGEGPAFYFCGFGHGNMLVNDADTSIFMDAAQSTYNYNTVSNWPIGVSIYGTVFQINQLMHLTLPTINGGGTNLVQVNTTRLFGDYGCRTIGQFQALVAGVGWQDTYLTMFPLCYDDIDRIKPVGETAGHPLAGQPQTSWHNTIASEYQAYKEAEHTIMATMLLRYGVPVRRSDATLPGWGLNQSTRAFFAHNSDFAKFYVSATSSQFGFPRTSNLLGVGEIYQWQNDLRTKFKSGGPT